MMVVDCPMRGDNSDPSIQNVSWSLDGDPLASATVSFDPTSGALTVAGSFAMHNHYHAAGLITFSHDDPLVLRFSAAVFWNDGSRVVAGIARTA